MILHPGICSSEACFRNPCQAVMLRQSLFPPFAFSKPNRAAASRLFRSSPKHFYSTTPPPPTPPSAPTPAPIQTSPLAVPRLNRYLPRLSALSTRTGVPLPNLALSFLILHELTALIPLVALFFVFQALGAGAGIVAWVTGLRTVPAGREGNTTKGGEINEGRWDWRNIVGGWYDEGEKRVGKVGRSYGVLGYEKDQRSADGGDGKEVAAQTGSSAAGKVADAIASYVAVKVSLEYLFSI